MLRHLPAVADPNALVGALLADDAAVYQVADDLALVATVDYITPVVDDPYAWGTIAAANALSASIRASDRARSCRSIVTTTTAIAAASANASAVTTMSMGSISVSSCQFS